MVGKLLSLAMAISSVAASLLDPRQVAATQSGNTITLSGVSSGSVIIIQTNPGGGAAWANVNQPMAATTGKTHTVVVGGTAGTIYTPDSVNAAVGDVVEFQFMQKNHTVTQSTFGAPCVNAKLFDTGFVPNANGLMPAPAMRVQINSTAPTWFYCRQAKHCGAGMVFSVNPTAEKTAAAFKAAAIAQNGTAAAGAPPAAAAAAPPAAVTAGAGSASSASPASAVTAGAASPSIASGTGSLGANGACSCSCLCGSNTFGNLQAQSPGMFGGFGGTLNMAGASPA